MIPIKNIFLICISSILWIGCRNFPIVKPAGDEIYNIVEQSTDESGLDRESSFIEVSFENTTAEALQYLLEKSQSLYRVYICVNNEDVEPRLFSGYLHGDILEELFAFAVANSLKYDVIDGSVFLVASDYSAPIVYNFDVNLEEDELKALSDVFPNIEVVQLRDRLVVKGAFNDVVQVHHLIDGGGFSPSSYIFSIVLLRTKRSAVHDIQAKIEVNSVDLISRGLSLYDVFSAYGGLDLSSGVDSIYNEQELYCTSGRQVSFSIGSEIQREQRAITDMGTSTVQDWRVFDDGLTLEATLFDGRGADIYANINFESSKFNDSSDVSKDKTSIQYERLKVQTGKIYYLCQYADNRHTGNNGLLRVSSSRSQDVVSVWFCAVPVAAKMERKKLY